MKKIVVFLLFLLVFCTLSAWDEFNRYSIADELKKPGVKLVAVDFYATWCEPCNAAIPKWKKLQEKYGNKGFELIVVSVQSGDGHCSQPQQWNPDKIVCDYEGDIAKAWRAGDLPQAFLWSWQGNMLVAHGTVDNVTTAVDNYFKQIPRVYVDEESDENIYTMVRSELIKFGKVEVVASEKERQMLAELRKKSDSLRYDNNLKCKMGNEISANSRLVISEQKRGKKDVLVLDLFSVEKSCLTASGTANFQGSIETDVAKAVYNLLKNLYGTLSMPNEDNGVSKSRQQDWEIGAGEDVIVKFESIPAGAAVLADGKLLCKSTPCSKVLPVGNHKIQMQMEDNCFYDSESIIMVKRDKTNSVSLSLAQRESAIKVYAQDESGNDIDADVFIDDKLVGKAPNSFKVPLCSKKMLVTNGVSEYSEELSLKEKQVKTIQAKLESKKVELVSEHSDEFTLKKKVLDTIQNNSFAKIGLIVFAVFFIGLWAIIKIVKSTGPIEFVDHGSYIELKKPLHGIRMIQKGFSDRALSWDESEEYAENLRIGGYSDWRVPTIYEFKVIYKNQSVFGIATCGCCWASNEKIFSFIDGSISGSFGFNYRVRCVR